MLVVWVILALVAAVFWFLTLCSVLSASDEEFPGRNDKLMWAIIVFFGSVLGAILFFFWKWEYQRSLESARKLEREVQDMLKRKPEPGNP